MATPAQNEFNARRNALRAQLPELAIRIFQLKGRHGGGYNYHMARQIGGVLHRSNDLEGNLGSYTEQQLMIDEVVFADLLEDVTKGEAEADYQGMLHVWLTAEVYPRIDAGERSFRLAPPPGAEIWEHCKEDRFYREIRDSLSIRDFQAAAAKPLKKEPRHVTLIWAKE